MLNIDGVSFDLKLEVTRTARMLSSEISGRMMDATWFNDVYGTYYDYDFVLRYPLKDQAKYAALYEMLTVPVAGHAFVFPYNNLMLEVTARIEEVPDEYVEKDDRRTWWRALGFTAKANTPTKEVDLGAVISNGLPATPEGMPAQEGDTYRYTGGAWVPVSYVNGDEIYW